ncbi:MAG: hypothetical protein NUV94_00125 [Candidatus Acetothermia bacterium]|nr:hypothetical protein [Candidatus Acetothermia bacterium]
MEPHFGDRLMEDVGIVEHRERLARSRCRPRSRARVHQGREHRRSRIGWWLGLMIRRWELRGAH